MTDVPDHRNFLPSDRTDEDPYFDLDADWESAPGSCDCEQCRAADAEERRQAEGVHPHVDDVMIDLGALERACRRPADEGPVLLPLDEARGPGKPKPAA